MKRLIHRDKDGAYIRLHNTKYRPGLFSAFSSSGGGGQTVEVKSGTVKRDLGWVWVEHETWYRDYEGESA